MDKPYPKALMQIEARYLGPYRESNTGIPYVHTFDSGKPGPHAMINALTKGNELCGMEAVCLLFENAVRPIRGALTLSFANVAAYETFNPEAPDASKFLDDHFNRIWIDTILNGGRISCELERARQMRSVLRDVDILLDLMSTCYLRDPEGWIDPPLLAFVEKTPTRKLTAKMGFPIHLIGCTPSPTNRASGLLYEYGVFGNPDSDKISIIAECGPHFTREAAETAFNAALRFLNALDMLEPEMRGRYEVCRDMGPLASYTDMMVPVAQTDTFRYAGPFRGYEEFSMGELIGVDGDREIRAPYDRCVLIAVASRVPKGEGIGHLVRRL